MKKLERNKILQEAINKWGVDAQLDMIIEECSELIKAVCKLKRKRGDFKEKLDNFIDELADVKLMVQQGELISELWESSGAVKERYDFKINRLVERLKEGTL